MVIKNKLNPGPNEKELLSVINLIKLGQFTQAQDEAEKLLKQYSNSFKILNLLGLCLINQNQINKGINCYKSAIQIKPDFAEAHNNLGIAYKNIGMINEAIESYHSAIKLKSNFAEAYNNLGLIMMDQNKIIKAKNNFRTALKLKPKLAFAHRYLSIITKYSHNDPHIREMEKIMSNTKTNDNQKMHVAFGLGKAYEDTQNYENAFKYFKLANQLRRRSLKYNIKNDVVFFKNLKKSFSKELFSKFKNSGNSNKTPIFIVGMFRSGTTLIEQILASHSKVYGGGESKVLFQAIINFLKFDFKSSFAKNLNDCAPLIFENIGKLYISVAKKFQPNFEHITDKQPLNFKWLGFIKLALPNAKIIHCVRNPIDNCLSIYKNYFDFDDNPYAYDLDELAQHYNLYTDLMKFWHSMLPGFIYDISYEKLIKNQKDQTKKLLDYCNLNWEENCMNFFKNKRNVNTASVMQVRKPLYKDSINSWKNYEKHLSILIDKLNTTN